MAKKRKTLPKDFRQLIEKGDIEELKAVYNRCELTAYQGYSKENALFFADIPAEFVRWLTEQGLDINCRNSRGETPLHVQVRYPNCCAETFIELGADIFLEDFYGETPLHKAAARRNAKMVKYLLEHGAKIDAVARIHGWTPLEEMMATCMNMDIVKTAETAEVFLNAGAVVNEAIRQQVKRIGETFEFHKGNFNKEYLDEIVDGLNRLYNLFGVEPVPPRKIYDGVSPITVTSGKWQQQHDELWKLLVPGSGHADTLQGEVIRITGRVSYEILDNGGMNWDSDYRKMLKALREYFREGNLLPDEELAEADRCIGIVSKNLGEDEAEKLCELAVHWVIENPSPIKLDTVDYRR